MGQKFLLISRTCNVTTSFHNMVYVVYIMIFSRTKNTFFLRIVHVKCFIITHSILQSILYAKNVFEDG